MPGDLELVVSLKEGDTEALEQLIGRWRSGAEAYACSLLHDPQAAEDAVQEAFSRIYAVRADIDEHRSFSAYLYTIVKRICIDELRRKKRYPALPGNLPDPPVPSAEAEYINRWERLNRIHLLAELDETDRELLTAFSLEGKPTKQIAREMNLTDGQVRVRLHRIRKKMKKGMKDDA
ncbi:MAG: sigma-70 family RNA polymerase sigma factor [Clostridia bacterium]|nr:sigma-70 family RNA polymerase sigma factor [Clostridia bacterium]